MPLNVRSFCTSILLIFTFSFFTEAQTSAQFAPSAAPSAADVMRERVAKAKAFIAVKNFNAAIYELQNIRRETSDQTVGGVINVLLMNSYLEQGDYKRAQDFLAELAKAKKDGKPNAAANYLAVAGQVVKGARNQLERYKSLGLSVSDRSLPSEATNDVQKMRETLETVVAHSKVLGADKKQTADAMALLEEATNARGSLAKDEFDAKRWKNEVSDAREMLANSQSVIVNAAGEPTTIDTPQNSNGENAALNPSANNQKQIAVNNQNTAPSSPTSTPVFQPVPNSNSADSGGQTTVGGNAAANNSQSFKSTTATQTENKVVETPPASPTQTATSAPVRNRRVENTNGETASNQNSDSNQNVNNGSGVNNSNTADAAPKNTSPLQVGSLVEYATQKTTPVYPPTARSMRASGVVRVELTIDENGQVAQVQNTSGPALLQRAAADAVKKWRFKPFVRGGEPVKATGFVSFNFSL
ncbi:MAG: TonB family protein [Acidobacteria bacterium]|nr:TonB family protein [Acidobacteriota bacterium]